VAVAVGELTLSDQEHFDLSLVLVDTCFDPNPMGPAGFWKVHGVSPESSDYSLSS
jgi:hypothetical protein